MEAEDEVLIEAANSAKEITEEQPEEWERWQLDTPDAVERYFLSIGKFPLLSDKEVEELSKRILEKGDTEARNKLVQHNLRLVVKVARQFYVPNRPVPDLMDLFQVGNLGLTRAAELYDYRFGVKFSTFAYWWIKQSVMRTIRDQANIVRIPVHAHELWSKFRKAKRDFVALNGGKEPNPKDLAEVLGIPLEDVEIQLFKMKSTPGYEKPMAELDAPHRMGKSDTEKEGSSVYETTPDQSRLNPEQMALAKDELSEACKRVKMISRLVKLVVGERDRVIFEMRYGFDGSGEPKTLEEVGQKFLISRQRVLQIQIKIWKKLEGLGVKQNDAWLERELWRIQTLENLVGEPAPL